MEDIRNIDSYEVVKTEKNEIVDSDEEEILKKEIMQRILGEKVAVSVGNFIFIPPLSNPIVTTEERTNSIKNNKNFNNNYVKTKVNIDGEDMYFMTHISRIVHEGNPPGVNVYSIEKFNEDDLRIAFKNDFPETFIAAAQLFYEHKKSLTHNGGNNGA
jgi:hypothetical protein